MATNRSRANSPLSVRPISASVSKEEAKHAWFYQVEENYAEEANVFFQKALDCRVRALKRCLSYDGSPTLEQQLSSRAYVDSLTLPLDELSASDQAIEQQAIFLFSHIANAWNEYLIWQLTKRYPAATQEVSNNDLAALSARLNKQGLNERSYQHRVVAEIGDESEKYWTLHHPAPMVLSDAIQLINLSTLVREQHWYEMLPLMALSRSGAHFLLLYRHSPTSIPLLLSTARICHHIERQHWLFYSEFFQSRQWHRDGLDCALTHLNKMGLTKKAKAGDVHSVECYEQQLWQSLHHPHRCCEIIRMTVSGSRKQRLFFLYLAQKRLIAWLDSQQYQLGFVVIEQPLMIDYYKSLPSGCFIPSALRVLSKDGLPTYKGLWSIKELNQAFQQASFADYNQALGHKPNALHSEKLNHLKLNNHKLNNQKISANHHNQSGHRYCQPNDKNNAQSQQRQPMVKSRTHA
ncbi:hypothetical protein H4F05_09170 [Vibrio cholerae]